MKDKAIKTCEPENIKPDDSTLEKVSGGVIGEPILLQAS